MWLRKYPLKWWKRVTRIVVGQPMKRRKGNFNPSSEGISDQASRPIRKGEFMVMEAA